MMVTMWQYEVTALDSKGKPTRFTQLKGRPLPAEQVDGKSISIPKNGKGVEVPTIRVKYYGPKGANPADV